MISNILFITFYIFFYVIFLLGSQGFDHHYLIGMGFWEMIFSIQQFLITLSLFTLFLFYKKKMTAKIGFILITLSFLVLLSISFSRSYNFIIPFLIEYFFTFKGFVIVELPHILALIISILTINVIQKLGKKVSSVWFLLYYKYYKKDPCIKNNIYIYGRSLYK